MKTVVLAIMSFFLINGAIAQEKPMSAEKVLKKACTRAKKDNKKVFVIFHASWCGWCHRMDTIMNLPETKAFFDNNFVIEHLVVQEAKDKKHLENPGAEELMKKHNGDKQGIPFWLIFDEKGTFLADSRMPAKDKTGKDILVNTGCPANPDEVDYFIQLLKKTTTLQQADLDIIAEKFILKKATH